MINIRNYVKALLTYHKLTQFAVKDKQVSQHKTKTAGVGLRLRYIQED